jgi:Mrp family chromosome partitioning ATPase
MDRITRALDLARAQGSIPTSPSAPPPKSSQAGEATGTYFAPIIQLDPVVSEREFILPPNAGGPRGAAYKLLRTQVLQRLDQLGANTLAVLSTRENQGNTLTAINLAIAIAAEHGRTALLVDLNLRNPGVHRRLGFEPVTGVEECLRGSRSVEQVIVRVADYERLAVMPARLPVEHSSELLSSQRAAALMDELRSRYNNRIMIFDLPPVLSADDALAFSRVVQAGLLVVTDEKTRRDDVRRCVSLLGDLPLLGTVLNASRDVSPKSY